jgi:hypothetical protein
MRHSDNKENGWTWRQAWRRAIEVLQQEGPQSLWFKVLSETVYRRVILLERLLDEPEAEVTPGVPVDVGLLKETEIDEYVGLRPEADPAAIRRRFAGGHLCFAVRHQERLVSVVWVTTGQAWIDYLDREIQPAGDEVYPYESFTAPDMRGQNLASVRSTRIQRHFKDAGYRRFIVAVTPENTPSLRHTVKVGHRPFGVMGYIKLGPWRYDFCRVRPRAASG